MLAALNTERVRIGARASVYADAEWVRNYRIDPFGVPASEKIAVLRDYSGRLPGADRASTTASASLNAVKGADPTPTPSGHRLPNSGCGCCRAWMRLLLIPRAGN